MADVTLNAAMRSNLLSLQQTTALQAKTQGRLATGKKVNSALDNPSSFFAAQSLTDRANDLSNLLDGMGQAIQALTAASQGITSAESLVSQMQAVANSAAQSLGSSSSGSASSKEGMTATASGHTAIAANSATVDMRSMVDTNNNSIGVQFGDTFTVKVDSGNSYTFTVGASNANNTAVQSNGGGVTLNDLATWANNVDGSGNLTMSTAGGAVTISSTDTSHTVTIGGSLATELGISQTALTSSAPSVVGTATLNSGTFAVTMGASSSTMLSDLTDSTGGTIGASGTGNTTSNFGNYAMAGSTLILGTNTLTMQSNMTVQDLTDKINQVSGLSATYSKVNGIVISNTSGAAITVGGTASSLIGGAGATIANNATSTQVQLYQGLRAGGSSGLSQLATYSQQYDTLRTQLDQLVKDSSYQGINLVAGSSANPLTVQFNNDASNPNKLTISAVDLTSNGLGLQSAAANWSGTASIQSTISSLTSANNNLRTQSSTFGQNLTTVQTRQDFTTNLINTLQTGAGNLTNADMNTESANMLALQTQNQLGISSLSLASQAAQSILKLFP